MSFHLFNEALGKENISKEEKFQLAHVREGRAHVRERDSIISRVRDQIAIAQKSRRRESAQISRSRAVQSGTAVQQHLSLKSVLLAHFPRLYLLAFGPYCAQKSRGQLGTSFKKVC